MKKTLAVLAVGAMLPLCAGEGVRFGAQLSTATPVGSRAHLSAGQSISLGGVASYNLGGGHGISSSLSVARYGVKKIALTDRQEAVEAVAAKVGIDEKLEDDSFGKAHPAQAAQTSQAAIAAVPGTRREISEASVNLSVNYTMHFNKKETGGFFALVGLDAERNRFSKDTVDILNKAEKKEWKKEKKTEEYKASQKKSKADEKTQKAADKKAGKTEEKLEISSSTDGKRYMNNLGYNLGVGYDFDKNLTTQAVYTVHHYEGQAKSRVNLEVLYRF
jgi:hypothetical protein